MSHTHAHHGHAHGHGHSHALVDDSIKRSREGLRAVGLSLLVLRRRLTRSPEPEGAGL